MSYVYSDVHTVLAYITVWLWPRVGGCRRKSFILLNPLFLWLNYSFGQQNSFIPLCSVPPPPLWLHCPFTSTKHFFISTTAYPPFPPTTPDHLLCPHCPVFALSFSHILSYPPSVPFTLSSIWTFQFQICPLSMAHCFIYIFSLFL